MSRPCVFFDRDGIVNRPPTADRYVRHWGEFEPIPEFIEVLRAVKELGYEAVVVTNQKGIATGRMTREAVNEIHRNLSESLGRHGLRLLDVVVCESGDDDHPDRKPNPGMLLGAARRHDLDLSRSWMVGDHERDVEAGRRAGCRTVFVGPPEPPVNADYRVANIGELAEFIRRHLPLAGRGV